MKDWVGKRYWIVGASAGLGSAIAHQLSRVGTKLVLSARDRDALESLAAELPSDAEVVTLDVTDDQSCKDAAAAVGDVDGIIFCAGVYWPFAAQDWDSEKAMTTGEVNYLGAMRFLGHVVPRMIERDHGHIVMVGSLTGFRGLPGSFAYTSSKAAVMSLAECLHADLRKTGVQVQLLSPGFVKTRLTDKNDFDMPQLMEPEDAARIVFEHINSDRFARSFPFPFAWVFKIGRILPQGLYYRLFS
ncbi:SDR family NAD(P)-dependent oxidoreductase [Roseivivax sp. CAU 1753]